MDGCFRTSYSVCFCKWDLNWKPLTETADLVFCCWTLMWSGKSSPWVCTFYTLRGTNSLREGNACTSFRKGRLKSNHDSGGKSKNTISPFSHTLSFHRHGCWFLCVSGCNILKMTDAVVPFMNCQDIICYRSGSGWNTDLYIPTSGHSPQPES